MTRNSIKLGVAAVAALLGGGLLVQGAADAPAFAQATAGQAPTGTTGQRTTTGGAGGTAERRLSRPGTNAPRGRNVGPGQVGPGGQVSNDPVALTAAECTALGGRVWDESPDTSCRYPDGTRGGRCGIAVATGNRDALVQVDHYLCINERR
jgi:hypothetical protein